MKHTCLWFCALGLLACVGLTACGLRGADGTLTGDPVDEGSNTNPTGDDASNDPTAGDTTNGDNTPRDDTTGDNVGDGTAGGGNGAGEPAQPRPPDGTVSARVRNESAFRADVTLRFVRGQAVVHLAFVRVLADTVTTVVSPKIPDLVELSGVDERGQALPSETRVFGVDFDETTPAEYVIPAVVPDEPAPEDPMPGDVEPPTLTMLEPASDVTRTLGSTLLVGWVDSGGAPGALVRVFLRLSGSAAAADLIPAGPAVGAAFDGINDKLLIVLEELEPGFYEIVGEIDDGIRAATSAAPGRVQVTEDPDNAVPSLEILAPTGLTELHQGDLLPVRWTDEDEDEDDNAIITFWLEKAEPTGVPVGPFLISPPLAEDPDGDQDDAATLVVSGVLPGLYDLVGKIDDGQSVGTARVEGIVRVLAEADNLLPENLPELTLTKPDVVIEVRPGDSFVVQWNDSDDNDNARISLLLDPDLEGGVLDGNEWLLVSSLDEDDDGPGDEITLGIPAGVDYGLYRVAGAITDGASTLPAWAPGRVYFGPEFALSFDVRTRLGETVDVLLGTADIPPDANVRFYLSNLAHGGDERVDVTHLIQNVGTELRLPSSPEDMPIPNRAWPRQFDLQAEVDVGGITYSTVAPGSVWVRQEVEVISAELLNYSCTEPPPRDRRFVGLRITWYGGGFQEREPHAEVSFWLSNDGSVPDDGEPDPVHRIIHRALESPNVIRVVDVPIVRGMIVPVDDPEELRSPLAAGAYHVIAVVEPEGFGRINSPPLPDPIVICVPPRSSSSDEQPL